MRPALAAPEVTVHKIIPPPIREGGAHVNPLQQLLADAMARHGMPLDQRGSRAWLARRAGVSEAVVSYTFAEQDARIPDPPIRVKLARALGLSVREVDEAADKARGWQVSDIGGPTAVLDELRAVVARGHLSPAERLEVARALEAIVAELDKTSGNGDAE